MADLRLDISAEDKASGALKNVAKATGELSEATEKQGESMGRSVAKWQLAMAAAEKAVEFVREGVHAYMEQEKADKALALSAGVLTDRFKAQADAMESLHGVDGVMVERMQDMLLTFGVAAGDIEKTTTALLEYAARTGTDGVSATDELRRSVETGKSGFKGLNLEMSDTATQGQRLAGFVDALGAKFAGSLAANDDTLSGKLARTSAQVETLQKGIVGFLSGVEDKVGVVKGWALIFDALNKAMAGPSQTEAQRQRYGELQDLETQLLKNLKLEAAWANGTEYQQRSLETWKAKLIEVRAEMAQVTGALSETAAAEAKALATPGAIANRLTDKGRAEAKAAAEAAKKQREDEADEEQKGREEALAEMQKDALAEAEALEKQNAERKKLREQEFQAKVASDMRLFHEKQENAKAIAEWDKRQLELERENAKAEAEFQRQLGEQIGGAFAQGMASAISELGKGGEVDIASILIDIMVTAAGMGLTATGFGYLAPIVGAVGGAAKSAMHTSKRHEGGWIEAPRYHSGAWVGADEQPAILQNGERVLSRAEVRGMGGPSGVDAAARGGGGASVTVQTFDGQTTRDFFERAGGRALLNAVRTGRGAPALLFGGG